MRWGYSKSKRVRAVGRLVDELVGTLHGSQSPLVCEWVNERHKLYSTLDKGAI